MDATPTFNVEVLCIVIVTNVQLLKHFVQPSFQ